MARSSDLKIREDEVVPVYNVGFERLTSLDSLDKERYELDS